MSSARPGGPPVHWPPARGVPSGQRSTERSSTFVPLLTAAIRWVRREDRRTEARRLERAAERIAEREQERDRHRGT